MLDNKNKLYILIGLAAVVIIGLVVWLRENDRRLAVDGNKSEAAEVDWQDNAPAQVTLDPATLDSKIEVHQPE